MDLPLVTIFLAGPPRGKGRPKIVRRPVKGGGMFPVAITDDATADYEARLRSVAIAAMGGREPFTGSLDVRITATFAISASWSKKLKADALANRVRPGDLGKKPDWDNIGKITDALNGIVWTDDLRVDDGFVRRLFGEAPGLLIEVRHAEVAPPEIAPLRPVSSAAGGRQPELAL